MKCKLKVLQQQLDGLSMEVLRLSEVHRSRKRNSRKHPQVEDGVRRNALTMRRTAHQ